MYLGVCNEESKGYEKPCITFTIIMLIFASSSLLMDRKGGSAVASVSKIPASHYVTACD